MVPRLKRLLAAFAVLGFLAGGCAGIVAQDIREANASNLKRLRVGMSKQEVTDVMGTRAERVREDVFHELRLVGYLYLEVSNPYKTEIVRRGGHHFEVLYYYADIFGMQLDFWDKSYTERKVRDDVLTPVVLKNGKVIGWGWEVLEKEGLIEPDRAPADDESVFQGS